MQIRSDIDLLIDIAIKRAAFLELLITLQINKYVESKMNTWLHKKVLKSTYEDLSARFTSGDLAYNISSAPYYWGWFHLEEKRARVKRMLAMFRSIKFSKSDITLTDTEWHLLTSDIGDNIFVY